MKIIRLEAENFKRIRAINIAPVGNTTILGGSNAQGKSSALDAIEAALGGKGSAPAEPIRRGQKSARVVLELDDLIVKRTFSEGGASQLVVTNKDGAPQKSPQTILDKLVGTLSFDPLRFTRMDPKEQVATLRTLVGLDFSKLDGARAKAYDERTEVGRELKRTGAQLQAAVHHDDAPEKESSIAELAVELEVRRKQNVGNAGDREKLERLRAKAIETKDEIAELEKKLLDARTRLEGYTAEGKTLAVQVAGLVDANEGEVLERMRTAESSNAKVRANAQHAALADAMAELAKRESNLTSDIENIDAEKQRLLSEAKFSVPGLAFDDSGVTLNGLPFAQASGAEQLRLSVAIGLAMNPELKVLLVRDGALLDEQSLAAIAKQATDAGGQLWIEVVGDHGEATVVIEDGAVQERTAKAAS